MFNFDVGHILVDTSSSVSVMFAEAFSALQVPDNMINRSITNLVSFFGDVVQPIRSIHLPIAVSLAPHWGYAYHLIFLILDCPTTFNVILGRLALA
ncbi:unnamed protein product [Prunus armeniaca]